MQLLNKLFLLVVLLTLSAPAWAELYLCNEGKIGLRELEDSRALLLLPNLEKPVELGRDFLTSNDKKYIDKRYTFWGKGQTANVWDKEKLIFQNCLSQLEGKDARAFLVEAAGAKIYIPYEWRRNDYKLSVKEGKEAANIKIGAKYLLEVIYPAREYDAFPLWQIAVFPKDNWQALSPEVVFPKQMILAEMASKVFVLYLNRSRHGR